MTIEYRLYSYKTTLYNDTLYSDHSGFVTYKIANYSPREEGGEQSVLRILIQYAHLLRAINKTHAHDIHRIPRAVIKSISH